uniref:Uncharacterized protein n=1 Tax=Lepeophtheirus salmonis TaxID=72036 RepID=A0A0K2TMZ6_LEPSM
MHVLTYFSLKTAFNLFIP